MLGVCFPFFVFVSENGFYIGCEYDGVSLKV